MSQLSSLAAKHEHFVNKHWHSMQWFILGVVSSLSVLTGEDNIQQSPVSIHPISSCSPPVLNPQPLDYTQSTIILPCVTLEPSTSTLAFSATSDTLDNYCHCTSSRLSRSSRPATQKHHHMDHLVVLSTCAQTTGIHTWTLFIGVWLDYSVTVMKTSWFREGILLKACSNLTVFPQICYLQILL